jgi:hypothetical protein
VALASFLREVTILILLRKKQQPAETGDIFQRVDNGEAAAVRGVLNERIPFGRLVGH